MQFIHMLCFRIQGVRAVRVGDMKGDRIMAVNRFVLNGISYHGHGAIKEIPGIVNSKGFKKAFVASDPDLVKF